jgi:hypothetical protein
LRKHTARVQVGKIGGVDATLHSFADRRQIEAGDEVALYQEIGG